MLLNFNIGILGHVDCGKTTLAQKLSTIASTAAFDKNPQSKERGITLDLGFSALCLPAPQQVRAAVPNVQQLQLTFVDCPGHASLIRTIIGGAQIIDLMLLVIDAQKGVQTQTAECIVIGELLQRKLIVVINKIDMLEQEKRDATLLKLDTKLRKTLAATKFAKDFPIFHVSAQNGANMQQLIDGIVAQVYLPQRDLQAPLLMYVDHCFNMKGQGTVCTGTIVQGQLAVHEVIEIPAISEQRKVKSIQMFRRAVQTAAMGDRIGLCLTQFNAKQLERGVLAKPGYLRAIYAACIRLQRIRYYKMDLRSKSKFHISIGVNTVMANITIFRACDNAASTDFSLAQQYEYVEQLTAQEEECAAEHIFALLEFETPVLAAEQSILIASKLDMDTHSNSCRLAFWGNMQWKTHQINYTEEILPQFKIFKHKLKQGNVQRLVSERQVIVQNLFKKAGNRDVYVGKKIELSTGESGVIESTFGQTSKVKICFPEDLKPATIVALKEGRFSEVQVLLKFKKYIFNKSKTLIQ